MLPLADAGSCTAGDLKKIKALPADTSDPSFGAKTGTCGRSAYSIFSGKFDRASFNKCMGKAVGISEKCSDCFADVSEYGAANCKVACLAGWCKKGCLDCTADATAKANTCAGWDDAPKIKPCLAEETLELSASAGSCSAGDLKKIKALPTDTSDGGFGAKTGACGRSAYSIFSGKFDRASFNTCMGKAVGISEKCSDCYADVSEYGAANCKVACLAGWCKKGCLDCTADATVKANKCAGYDNAPTLKPCLAEEENVEVV